MLKIRNQVHKICCRTRLKDLFSKQLQISDETVCKHGTNYMQRRTKKSDSKISSLFVPVNVKPNPDDINVGAELTGSFNKAELLKLLNKFYQKPEVKQLLTDNGLDSKMFVFFSESL